MTGSEVLSTAVKKCTKCKEWKPATTEFFGRDKCRPDGFFPQCKRCRVKNQALYDEKLAYAGKPFKRCSTCKAWKDIGEFYPNPTRKDGLHHQCKACAIQSANQWVIKYPDRAAQKNYNRYWNNKERENARFHEYYLVHTDEMRQKAAEYSKTPAGKTSQKRYQSGPKYKAAVRKYLHTEKGRLTSRKNNRNRRALKLNARGEITRDEEKWIMEFYGYRCLRCGRTDTLAIDHVISLSRGGDDTIENAQILCKKCNSKKGTKTIDYRDRICPPLSV